MYYRCSCPSCYCFLVSALSFLSEISHDFYHFTNFEPSSNDRATHVYDRMQPLNANTVALPIQLQLTPNDDHLFLVDIQRRPQ